MALKTGLPPPAGQLCSNNVQIPHPNAQTDGILSLFVELPPLQWFDLIQSGSRQREFP